MTMTETFAAHDPAELAYWNGPPPPYAPLPPVERVSVWSRPSTWLWITAAVIIVALAYFAVSAAASFAGAPGGCGGG